MEKEEFKTGSAGHITRRQRQLTKNDDYEYKVVTNPHHHQADLDLLNTGVYYYRCFVKCDFQTMNFCTYLTGHCLLEENGEKIEGERIILK